jgi:hypothetical protein
MHCHRKSKNKLNAARGFVIVHRFIRFIGFCPQIYWLLTTFGRGQLTGFVTNSVQGCGTHLRPKLVNHTRILRPPSVASRRIVQWHICSLQIRTRPEPLDDASLRRGGEVEVDASKLDAAS